MRSPVFLLMLPLIEQPTRTGPNSVAAKMLPTAAKPISIGRMGRTAGLMLFRAGIVCLALSAHDLVR
ncbi:hypothetical protein CQ13_29800 [Bradyrhizobium retamae]|uniref:Uncharacterized protein n=1 Tax=Bradyrhizobium retamae TaxID=1300035 RepID=A0A0R3MQQ2_9BRAD|nr:hypothetical protein CQ13_29800 [Bradyrhizobium retamae]